MKLTPLYQEKQSKALLSFEKLSFEYLTREYNINLKEDFPSVGIRYMTYYEKEQTLLISNISNGRVQLLNLANGSFRSFIIHSATVRKIIMFNDEIYTASWDGSIGVTNYSTLQQRIKLTDRTMGRCPFINISADGEYLFSFSYDSDKVPVLLTNRVRKWALQSEKLIKVMAASEIDGGKCKSGSIIIYQDKIYVCGDTGYFRIFDMKSGRMINEIITDSDFRSMTSIFHYHYILASDWQGYIHFMNLNNDCIDQKKKCHNADILCMRVHPTNPDIIITTCADGEIRVWEMPGFNLIQTIATYHKDLWSMVFIRDRLLVGNIDGEIQVYDMSDVRNIQYKGRIVLSGKSFVAQAEDSKMFFTNDLSVMEVYREPDNTLITGKESEHLLFQSNNLLVLRELFRTDDKMQLLMPGENPFFPLLTA
jgi:WD40 repeat protein